MQGVRARCNAELPPLVSIVPRPGRPVISVPRKTIRKLEKAVAVRGIFLGVPEENSGTFRNSGILSPESRNALNANLLRVLGQYCPGPCPHLLRGVVLEIGSYSLLECF